MALIQSSRGSDGLRRRPPQRGHTGRARRVSLLASVASANLIDLTRCDHRTPPPAARDLLVRATNQHS